VNKWRTFLLLLLAVLSINGFAQRRLTVVDVETLIPVVGANVVSREGTNVTDSLGLVVVSDSCQSLSFTHVNYESRIINVTELRRDTVYMISKMLNIKEVVVFGHGPEEKLSFNIKEELKRKSVDAQLAAANPNSGIQVFEILKMLIPKKWRDALSNKLRKNSKEERLKRLQKMLDEY
jgi:hypothetical protein